MSLKATFIQKSLAEYMERTITGMRIKAQQMGIGVTDEGLRSLSYQALQQGESSGAAKLSFKEYLRMVDMGAGRGHPLGGMGYMRANLLTSKFDGQAILKKNKVRKPKKFYSKTAYGNLTWLGNQLLYGYTEETIASLKKEMTNGVN
jgi:hypothetical protein